MTECVLDKLVNECAIQLVKLLTKNMELATQYLKILSHTFINSIYRVVKFLTKNMELVTQYLKILSHTFINSIFNKTENFAFGASYIIYIYT